MGSCLSLHCGLGQDLTGSTFSHYSLNSDSSYLDLYPGLRYAETEASLAEEDQASWRRSSVPLIAQWDKHRYTVYDPEAELCRCTAADGQAACQHPATRDVKRWSQWQDAGGGGGGGGGGGQCQLKSSAPLLAAWDGSAGGVVTRLRRSATLQYHRVTGKGGLAVASGGGGAAAGPAPHRVYSSDSCREARMEKARMEDFRMEEDF